MFQIESLLSARLFLAPQLVGDRLYFVSNLSGRLSLYVMDRGGSVPEPLLPPQVALQNPDLVGGKLYYVFPALGKVLLMLDRDGDENYQPMTISIEGGFPTPAFGDRFAHYRVHCVACDPHRNLAYFSAESRQEGISEAFQADLSAGTLLHLRSSAWGSWLSGVNERHTMAVLSDGYTSGDTVLYLWTTLETPRLLFGIPLEDRVADQAPPINGISACCFVDQDQALLCITCLYEDQFGLGYFRLAAPSELREVTIVGARHSGVGELISLERLHDQRYLVGYNVDGCSWLYTAAFDLGALCMRLEAVICGEGDLSAGVLESVCYDKDHRRFALSFSTATAPTQLYVVPDTGDAREQPTRERLIGIPQRLLSPGEDAAFTSWDEQRTSARLYLPAEELGFAGKRPLVYYIHGGPQSQERPDFAWFSMPLIQFLTLQGFAVFVPNVRGSTGYGLSYTKQVDRDWGGKDRLDHVHAMGILAEDPRIDTTRAAVVGRSYGGYMTLTLAARHPELWSAAVDLFGPYDLLKFLDYIPETWKPYFAIAVGDPAQDAELLRERSPSSHIDGLACPLLVIQGQNDPRVVERDSRTLVEKLRASGKSVEYLVFENEGHDILKFENRVRCYNAITEFFITHLRP